MQGDLWKIWIHLTLCSSAGCFNERQTWHIQPTHESLCSSGISLRWRCFHGNIFEVTLSIHYKMLQETCRWNLQRILCLGSILLTLTSFTLGSQDGSGGEERPHTIFFKWEQWPPMDDAMQEQSVNTASPTAFTCIGVQCNSNAAGVSVVLWQNWTEWEGKGKLWLQRSHLSQCHH